MFRRGLPPTQDSGLSTQHFVAATAATILALIPGIASAEALPAPEREGVMLWTTIVAILALAACAVGFAYRRMSGMDHPTPDEIEMLGGHGHGDEEHGETEHAPAGAHH